MDGDELEAACRQQERVHGLGDVDRAGEPLDGGPFEPVPGAVQQRHRDPGIDLAGARNEPRRQAVLPRTGEKRQDVGAVEACLERLGQPVHELAGAGPLAKGGPVVHQDAHARRIVAQRKSDKSLAFNGLTLFFGLC